MDFESIYQLYFKDVFLFLRSISVNEDIAEEITQETFTKALKAIDTFEVVSRFFRTLVCKLWHE